MSRVLSILFTGLLALIVCAPSALAQDASSSPEPVEQADETFEPTEEQQTLNDTAVQALIDQDYDRAVNLLKKSLALGEYNVTYLNLGRAYQKLDNCPEARTALSKARSAPAVASPPKSLVETKAEEYLAELERQCDVPGAVKWGLIGGGGAVAAFGAFGLLRASQLAPELERDEDGVVTDPSQPAAFDARAKSRTWSTIGVSALTVGVVAIGMGTYFALTGAPAESQPTASVGPDGSWRVGWSVKF